jgi:RecQ family ATP-dependent DNA helicase
VSDTSTIDPDSLQVSSDAVDLQAALQRYFGFEAFLAEQEEIVRRAVAGRDTLALMPTGAGKSLCYQLAAMLRPTPTLVLSPLIALMKDQLDKLPTAVSEHASLINSSLPPAEAAQRLTALATGRYKLIYAAPERLRQRQFVAALRSVGIGLVVIDEVHCVSMWGHDFRPDYMFIRSALDALGQPAVLGMTATATQTTERDIGFSLGRTFDVVRASVLRPNLRYDVKHVENEEERRRLALALSKTLTGSGIIYARSREKCEQIAELLRRNGVQALHYHAGLESAERSNVQEKFLRGSARVIVATTAFGMGIDKPDIRWVLLYNFPDSLESYVQMVGRAGRDGEPSTCVLIAGTADASNLRRFARSDLPTVDHLRSVYRHIRMRAEDGWAEVSVESLLEECGLGEGEDPRVLVGMLERVELLRRDFDSGRAMRIELMVAPPDSGQRIERLLAQYEELARERARRMVSFAESSRCRHLQVAEHFGETVEVPCGRCDVCSPGPDLGVAASQPAVPLPANVAKAILDAVDALTWPLGQTGLAATLKGSIDAPPSAQKSQGYGILAAAPLGTIKRWIGLLIDRGNLEPFESRDGFKLLRIAKREDLPNLTLSTSSSSRSSSPGTAEPTAQLLSKEDAELFERLRDWRRKQASEAGIAPFMVLHDRTLREIATLRPRNPAELSRIAGFGPAKLARYGDGIAAVLHAPES